MPTTKWPEDAKLTGVPATVASSPSDVRTVPAIDTADGSEIVNTWPATVTVGREATGSATEIPGSDVSSDLAVGSTFRKASNISASISDVVSFSTGRVPRDIVVGFSSDCGCR